MMDSATEIVLTGGAAQAGSVVRVGDTVRRPRKTCTPAVRAVLEYLADRDFDAAPRFLGMDARGREILSFLPGEPVLPPIPAWACAPRTLFALGRLIRRLHDALTGFPADAPLPWDQHTPPKWRRGRLCHNDLVMSNVIFRDRRPVGLIDFDMCSPGSAVWELGCAARHWIPLRGDSSGGQDGRARAVDAAGRRLRALLGGYGLPAADRSSVLDAIIDAELVGLRLLREKVRAGDPAYLGLWTAGAPQHIADRLCWVTAHRGSLLEAMARS